MRSTIVFLKDVVAKAQFVFCGLRNKTVTVKHFFLECPLYSAPRTDLLSSAARIFADRWSFYV